MGCYTTVEKTKIKPYFTEAHFCSSRVVNHVSLPPDLHKLLINVSQARKKVVRRHYFANDFLRISILF